MSAQQFMEMLFGKLPEFFKDEAELRALWSAPDTRKKLLQGLAEKGFGHEQLAEMQKIIDAEKSDLFDVLAHVAYALPPLTREERAAQAKVEISTHFNTKQQAFLDFVLAHYVGVGVDELDQEKLTPLLRLKYSIPLRTPLRTSAGPKKSARCLRDFKSISTNRPLPDANRTGPPLSPLVPQSPSFCSPQSLSLVSGLWSLFPAPCFPAFSCANRRKSEHLGPLRPCLDALLGNARVPLGSIRNFSRF